MHCLMHCLMHWLDALLDSRSTRLPFTSTPSPPSPPAPLAIRKAPRASVESIEPRPPRPCEVGRPKGGEGKTDANLTIFFSTCCALAPQLAATPWGGSPPRPSARKSATQTAQKTALCAPCEHPGGFEIRKSPTNGEFETLD